MGKQVQNNKKNFDPYRKDQRSACALTISSLKLFRFNANVYKKPRKVVTIS